MTRFSCADYAFPLLDRAKRFALLHLLGFRFVDLGVFERNPDLRPTQLAADPRGFLRKLQCDLEGTGLRAADVFLQTGLEPTVAAANDPDVAVRARNRELFLHTLDLCVALGSTHFTGLPGVWHSNLAEADDLALAKEEAVWRQQLCTHAGVTYAIEPHIGSLCPDVASAQAFVTSVRGLTLTLDYGHFIAAGMPSHDVHSLLPFTSHIHVRGGAPGHLQTTLDENTIDFAEMMHRLQTRNYRGFLAIEYVWTEWQQCNRVDNVSETLLLRRLLESLMNGHSKPVRSKKKAEGGTQ